MTRTALLCRFALALCLCASACARAQTRPPAQAEPDRPLSASALYARGMQLAASGDAVRAEQYLLLALRAGFPDERVIVPLVQVCIASSRLRTALAHAEPFLRKHPAAWQLRYLTAAIHLALERPALAAAELRRVLAQHPEAAQAHYLLGVTLRDGFGDAGAARASFEAYLRYAPHGPHAPELVAWLYEHASEPSAEAEPAEPSP